MSIQALTSLIEDLDALLEPEPVEPEPVSEAVLQEAKRAYDTARAEVHELMSEKLTVLAHTVNTRRSNRYRNRLLKADALDQAERDRIRLG